MIASLFVEQGYDRRFSETHRWEGGEVRAVEWNKETANWARESVQDTDFLRMIFE